MASFWSLRSNSVTRQVNFNRTKNYGKCPNSKTQMRLFGWFSNTVKKSHSDSLKKILCFTRKCGKMKFLELFLNTAFFTEKKAPKIPASYWWKCSTLDRSRDWAKLAKSIRIPDVSERWHNRILGTHCRDYGIAKSTPIHSVWTLLKMSHWIFQGWHFHGFFSLLKLTCLVTLFNRKLQMFQKLAKLGIFGIFNKLLSTQYENIARFARNVE